MQDEKDLTGEIHNEDELSSLLAGIRDENPFAVPEGYFDELPELINKRIERQKALRKKILIRSLYPAGLAAAMIAAILMFYFLGKKEDKKISTKYFSECRWQYNAIEDYLLNTAGIDEETIIDVMCNDANEKPAMNIENPFYDSRDSITGRSGKKAVIPADTSITKEDIIQYLMDEDIDPENDL